MASVGSIVIQFKAEADKARREIAALNRTLDDTGKTAGATGGKFAAFGKAGLAAVGTAAVAAGAALFGMARMAQEDYKEAEILARTLRNVAGATDATIESTNEWIDSMQIAAGVSDTELRDALGKLAAATGDVTKAQELTALAADVAAARNIDLSSAAGMLAKAVGGNTSALKRQMPFLDANRDGAITLAEAVGGLTTAYGGAAEAAADNDPFVRLNAIWEQTQENLGGALLPALDDLGEWLKDPENQESIKSLTSAFAELVKVLAELGSLYDKIPAPLKGILGGAELLGAATRDKPKPIATRDGVNEAALRNARAGVNVTINNGKQEPALDSAALAIRIAKTYQGVGR